MQRRAFFALVVVAVACSVPAGSAAGQPDRNVILFAWGGARRDHVDECLSRAELPNLQKLIEAGRYVKIDIEGMADNGAAWSQILTGYYPKTMDVYSHGECQFVPKGLSIFERLEDGFGKETFVTVAVLGKDAHRGQTDPSKKVRIDEGERPKASAKAEAKNKRKAAQPGPGRKTKGMIVEEDGVKYRVIPGSPYYWMKTAVEVWEYGLIRDEKVAARALELLRTYKDRPFFFFVHFAEGDRAGRKHGENSQEYNDTLISNDLWTGRIMDKVKEFGLADKTQFYITADHGLDGDARHRNAPHVFLATNNKAVSRDGRWQDVAPTILEAFGVDVAAIAPPMDGISLTKPDNRSVVKLGLSNAAKTKAMRKPDVIYVPTPQHVVDEMLRVARVTRNDVVYDLGCGDGRIPVTAARDYGCRAFGYDINPRRVRESLRNVEKHGVGHLVTIEQEDIFTLDLRGADVITLYLLPSLNVKLIPQLEKLKPGSRIVSHDFSMRGVEPDKTVQVKGQGGSLDHTIYLWTCPLKKVVR